MKLSVSNIGWRQEEDEKFYALMQKHGFSGLEIAPTRVFPIGPYNKIDEAKSWRIELNSTHGFDVPSIQSIWYGKSQSLFGGEPERQILADYTKKAVLFAQALGCKNIVFGCPKNRALPEGANPNDATDFFYKLGNYAAKHNTAIAIEANPAIYGTNFINTTKDAIGLINDVNSPGIRLNLDIGAVIENGESLDSLSGYERLINHVHISEPYLKKICARPLHKELSEMLKGFSYDNYVSIEANNNNSYKDFEEMLEYVSNIFLK